MLSTLNSKHSLSLVFWKTHRVERACLSQKLHTFHLHSLLRNAVGANIWENDFINFPSLNFYKDTYIRDFLYAWHKILVDINDITAMFILAKRCHSWYIFIIFHVCHFRKLDLEYILYRTIWIICRNMSCVQDRSPHLLWSLMKLWNAPKLSEILKQRCSWFL